jgi:gamma-glutamyltranspeptidase/glutathione hydrolase
MKLRSAVTSNDPIAEEAAQDFMISGGSAVGAVLCGYFAAAGAYASVLLSPVSILVGGIGAGARAFDGRLRQPGRGTKRPRGFKATDPIPDAARVSVPTGVAAVLVAHAYDSGQKLGSIMKAGITRAERVGAEGRAGLLRRVRAAGAGAMTEPSFVRSFLHVAGPSQGGLVTPSDFGPVTDIDQPAAERSMDGAGLLEPAWASESVAEADGLGIGCAVCAVDVRGVFAALTYRRSTDGLPLEELDLEAPLLAVPVKRGVARVTPGAPLPTPAPIALLKDASGALFEVCAAPAALRFEPGGTASPLLRVRRNAATGEVDVTVTR